MDRPTTPSTTSHPTGRPTRTTAPTPGQTRTAAPVQTDAKAAPTIRSVGHKRARKVSDYGRQLAEKQKARREYGLRETQFSRYFKAASKSTIATGQALLSGLETRLDNVVYRAGLAKSRPMARQIVGHGHVLVNGHRLNLPSYSVKVGDTIALKDPKMFDYNDAVVVPSWLSVGKGMSVKVERAPKADDLIFDIDTQLIVEFYSR